MDLAALADFNLVAVHGGFGKASRASGQSKATLSRRVRELEESLGVRLIDRGSHSLRLTEEGVHLHTRTEGLLGEIGDVGHDVGAGLGRARGRLRISAPMFFAHTMIGPLVTEFAKSYPDLQLELTAEDRIVDLVEDSYDVVIRMNPRADDRLVGRCFLRDRLAIVAPASMPRPPQSRGKLKHRFSAVLRTGFDDNTVWRVSDKGKSLEYYPSAVLRLSTPLLVRDAVREGAGAALLTHSAVAEDLATGRLVTWGMAMDGQIEGWVLHASRRLVSPKVSAFVKFICEYFEGASVG